MATMRVLLIVALIAGGTAHAQFITRGPSASSGSFIPPSFARADTLPVLQSRSFEKKKPFLAAVYSLLLPGMGELYAGDYSAGKYFSMAEGGLWLTFTGFELYGNALRDDSRSYAAVHAGASIAGKDDQFFVDIGNFQNVYDYNDKKMRDRTIDKLYDPAAGYYWSWENDAARSAFRAQRVRSDNMYNNKKFVVAAIIINHVASAINAVRMVVAHNKEISSLPSDLHFSASVMGDWQQPHGVMLTMSKEF